MAGKGLPPPHHTVTGALENSKSQPVPQVTMKLACQGRRPDLTARGIWLASFIVSKYPGPLPLALRGEGQMS